MLIGITNVPFFLGSRARYCLCFFCIYRPDPSFRLVATLVPVDFGPLSAQYLGLWRYVAMK